MKTQIKVNKISNEITEQLYKACNWELADRPEDGDEFSAIHISLMHRVISKMYQDINKQNTIQQR